MSKTETSDLAEIIKEAKHNAIEEYKNEVIKSFKALQFHTGRAWYDFDAAIDRCTEILNNTAKTVIAEDNDEQ